MKRLSRHVGLVIILTLFLVLGLLYIGATPPLETPDAPSHFTVVKHIADHRRLPPPNPASPDAGPVPTIESGPPVYYAPPLYYVLGAALVVDLDTESFADGVIPNPNWARGWPPTPGRAPENKNVYVYTADQHVPLAGWAAAMQRLRFFSLLLGALAVVGVYTLAHQLTNPIIGRAKLIATAFVAFNPAFLFITTGVTNDALLAALSTWAFVLMARIVTCHPSSVARHASLLGLVLGLALLTKQSAFVLLPVAGLAVMWSAGSRRQAVKGLLLLAVPMALVGGWWYAHNALTYGDPLGFAPHRPPTDDWLPSLSLMLRQVGQALQSYWAVFGWGLVQVEPAVYGLVAGFVFVGLAGCIYQQTRERTQTAETTRRMFIVLGTGILLNLLGLLLWLWRTSAPYGRLLYPTIGPLAALVVAGWHKWLGTKTFRILVWAAIAVMALFALVVPFRYLRPAFASPVVPLSKSFDARLSDIRFTEVARLLSYRIEPDKAVPGDEVALILYWQATASRDDDLTVFIQLAPRDPERRIASVDDYLGSSRYPTSVWCEGDVIEQVHLLQTPLDVPAPTLYWFTVGLYGDTDAERISVTADGKSVPERAVRMGPLWLLKRDAEPMGERVYYRLGSAIRLVGFDVTVAGTDALTVTLDWRAIEAPKDAWTVFVHLLDADGQAVAQHDGLASGGDYPVWAWQPGDRVLDAHTLDLPPDLAPGRYRVQIGLYQPGDGTRMPVFDSADRRLLDDVIPLDELSWPIVEDAP